MKELFLKNSNLILINYQIENDQFYKQIQETA